MKSFASRISTTLRRQQNVRRTYSTQKPTVAIFGAEGDNPLAFHVVALIKDQCQTLRLQTTNANKTRKVLQKHFGETDSQHIQVIEALTTDQYNTESTIYGANAVINVDRVLIEEERGYVDVYVKGVGNIAHIADKFGVSKLIHTSVMGADLDHESRFLDVNYRGEDIAYGEFPDATILRPNFATFGDRESIIEKFRQKIPLKLSPIVPYPSQALNLKIQPVHIQDVAQAVRVSLLEKDMRGRVLQLGGANTYTFPEFLRKVFGAKILVPSPSSLIHTIYAFTQFLPGAVVSREHIAMICMNNQDAEHIQLQDLTDDKNIPVDPSQSERYGTFKDLGITPIGF